MKTGMTLQELANEILRQKEAKQDYLASTAELSMFDGAGLNVAQFGPHGVTEIGHQQVGDFAGIPRAFYRRLAKEQPDLLSQNVTTLLQAKPTNRMVRTLDGNVRAFLSPAYRRLDNHDLTEAMLPILNELPGGGQVLSAQITDRFLYLQVVVPAIEGEVKVGDVVQAGLVISNSEVGLGRLQIEELIYRLSCKNGMITGSVLSRRHIGGRIGDSLDEAVELYQADTIRADDLAFWMKVRDVLKHAVNETAFQASLNKMREAAGSEPIQDVPEATRILAKTEKLTDDEASSVLTFLAGGGDLSRYGLANAVTAMAQTVHSYDRSVDLQRVGGRIMEMPRAHWTQLARATTNPN